MKNHLTAIILLLSGFTATAQWDPDLHDGTYRNPIINADYSDPDVIRVGEDYWMVASSFAHFPGIPVLHSRDLVNWEIVNHVYDRLPLTKYDRPVHGEGSWAPAIRFHDGMYYVHFCTPNDGLFVARATDPRGKWELTQMADVEKWEDPCPFWDDDGEAYLIRSRHRGGPAILHRMSPDGLRLLDDGVTVYHDEDANPILEGLKMMKRDGWYYILVPAGGVATGWQTMLRSRNIYGPYEARRVLEQGPTDINGPHQGALVDTPDGREWWFIHFQQKGPQGRVTHLQPAQWTDDGWAVIGEDADGDGIGNPVTQYHKPSVTADVTPCAPATSDDFSAPTLGLQWQWQAHERPEWSSLTERNGYMRLRTVSCPTEYGNIYYAGNLLLQKLPAPDFTAITSVEPHFAAEGDRAGLVTMGKSYSYIAVIEGDNGRKRIAVVTGRYDKFAVTPQEVASADFTGESVTLRADYSSDLTVRYSYSTDGSNFIPLGTSQTVTEGVWVGAKTGIFAITPHLTPSSGYADFDHFTIFQKSIVAK